MPMLRIVIALSLNKAKKPWLMLGLFYYIQ